MAKLHYDKEALLREYTETYSVFMKTLALAVGGVVAYFLIFIYYLGGWSHTPTKPFVDDFKSRISIEYEGTRLPMYEKE